MESGLVDRALSLAKTGIWSCDLADEELSWSAGVYAIFDLPPGTRIDRRETLDFYEPESRALLDRLRADAIAHGRGFSMDARIVTANGDHRWMRINAGTLSANGRAVTLYGTKQDVTDEFARWEALRLLAERDSLTGLASRAMFQAHFLDAAGGASALAPPGALILLDVDGFKQVNDGFGHAAGDACLQAVAGQLRRAFETAAMVARIGGDEFAVLLPAGPPAATVERAVASLLGRLANPIAWRDSWLRVTASAGIATIADPGVLDAEAIFAAADAALYRAKRAGRNRYCFAPAATR